MIPKPGKPATEVKSLYRSILYEIILQIRIKRIIEQRNLIPKYQFGFRNAHSTIYQVHRVTGVIERTLEEKNVCTAVFFELSQAFDKVSHKGLLTKLHTQLQCTVIYLNRT